VHPRRREGSTMAEVLAQPGWHCCIERSAHPTCSTCLSKSQTKGLHMSGLPGFCRVPEGSCLPAWCIARTLFASMQQCPARQIRLFWWIAGPTDELPRLGLPTGTYSAFGFGGNFLTVLPHARRCGVRAERHWRGTVQQRLQRVLGPSRAGTGLTTSRVVGSGASGTAD
jgi:hypothetical protein